MREWRDFTEALSAAMMTIAQRRFGKLSESLRGKEPVGAICRKYSVLAKGLHFAKTRYHALNLIVPHIF